MGDSTTQTKVADSAGSWSKQGFNSFMGNPMTKILPPNAPNRLPRPKKRLYWDGIHQGYMLDGNHWHYRTGDVDALCQALNAAEEGSGPSGFPIEKSSAGIIFGDRLLESRKEEVTLPMGIYKITHNDAHEAIIKPHQLSSDSYVELSPVLNGLIQEISWFLDSKDIYGQLGLQWRRGVLLYGPPGNGKCHGRGTPIMMFDGTIKPVESVLDGDQLMGDDGTPRRVLSLARGREAMVKVTPVKGDSYIVNRSHILSLVSSHTGKKQDVPVSNFLSAPLGDLKGYRVGVEVFGGPARKLPVDPYFLGVWLGDGSSRTLEVTTMDREIVDMLKRTALDWGLNLRLGQKCGRANLYRLSVENHGRGQKKLGRNRLLAAMQRLGVIGNKHVPFAFKTASREARLQLLAGLIDSDGAANYGGFDFVSILPGLANDVAFLARSLGLAAYVRPCLKRATNSKKPASGQYYRVLISGDCSQIPVRISRKRAARRKQVKNVLRTGLSFEELPEDEYFGFEIDGNHRYLLGDFTVTHNTVTIIEAARRFKDRARTFITNDIDEVLAFRDVVNDKPSICVMEELTEALETYSVQEFLNFLDGVDAWSNCLTIATTNYPEKLAENIVDRPSRFDRLIRVDNPNEDERRAYLTKLLGEEPSDWLLANTENMSIAYLKELVIQHKLRQTPFEEVLRNFKERKVAVNKAFRRNSDAGF